MNLYEDAEKLVNAVGNLHKKLCPIGYNQHVVVGCGANCIHVYVTNKYYGNKIEVFENYPVVWHENSGGTYAL